MNEPLFPCTNALQTPNPPFWTTKTVVTKFSQKGASTPTPCLDKAVHAQGGGGYHDTHVADMSQPPTLCDYKRVSNTPADTPEHKSTWNHSYTNTLAPAWTLPAACTNLQTTFSISLELQKQWFQKNPKVRKHDVAVFGQAAVWTRRGGGGGYCYSFPCLDRCTLPTMNVDRKDDKLSATSSVHSTTPWAAPDDFATAPAPQEEWDRHSGPWQFSARKRNSNIGAGPTCNPQRSSVQRPKVIPLRPPTLASGINDGRRRDGVTVGHDCSYTPQRAGVGGLSTGGGGAIQPSGWTPPLKKKGLNEKGSPKILLRVTQGPGGDPDPNFDKN